MLAEKFILVLEALIKSKRYPDRNVWVQSTSPHLPFGTTDGGKPDRANGMVLG